jgi:hypothetical protein
MRRIARPIRWLSVVVAIAGFGCGKISLPVTFALVGNNSISLEIPNLGTFGSDQLVGGAATTVQVNLDPFKLFSPQGLAASIVVNKVAMAAAPIDIYTLSTGTVCIYNDPNNPSGGFAFLRPLQQQADFTLTLNTLIQPTDPTLLTLFPDPLPFTAAIDQTVPLTLNDLFALLGGKGAGIQLHQVLSATLPPDLGILANAVVTADVTLATVQTFPTDPLLDECQAFLSGQ